MTYDIRIYINGAYYFSPDTVRITLTNECKLRSVTADAVKIVKRYE